MGYDDTIIGQMDLRDALRDYEQDGWSITKGRWPEPAFIATHEDYDASYEGPEDGWISNGLSVDGRTERELLDAIIEIQAEHPHFAQDKTNDRT